MILVLAFSQMPSGAQPSEEKGLLIDWHPSWIRTLPAETLERVQEYQGLTYGSVAWSPDGT